jgi:hydroxymethylbilane synthase
MQQLVIGTRGSALALWQTNWIKTRLEELHPGLKVEITIIKTTGDKLQTASLAQIGGKGVFTKELEDALLDGRVDLAVHSLKDLPTRLPDGLHLAAVTEREDVRDALIVGEPLKGAVTSISDLPDGARIGTSSLRRAAQLRHQRQDLEILELRGNVETRLRKLAEGNYEAIILASAGLLRLGFGNLITRRLDVAEMLPAVGQGALGIEARRDDDRVSALLSVLNHAPTRAETDAERALLRSLGGGCAVPIAAHAVVSGEFISLDALVAELSGGRVIRKQIQGQSLEARALGEALAGELIAAGAREILRNFDGQS